MKIRLELDPNIRQPELIIRAASLDDELRAVEQAVQDTLRAQERLSLWKEAQEFFIPPENVLFFQAVDGKTYAHTREAIFTTPRRLYELEELLPRSFVRAGKSVVLGTKHILALTRNLAGPSNVQFQGTHKQIQISRGYFKAVREKLNAG